MVTFYFTYTILIFMGPKVRKNKVPILFGEGRGIELLNQFSINGNSFKEFFFFFRKTFLNGHHFENNNFKSLTFVSMIDHNFVSFQIHRNHCQTVPDIKIQNCG